MLHTIHTDGGSRGNPGPSGCAFVISDSKGKVFKTGKYYLGEMTNNQAEYWGAICGLTEALKYGSAQTTLIMDSELVIKQLQGFYKVKDAELKVLNQKAKSIIAKFKKVEYLHVLRIRNAHADRLVNEAIDAKTPILKIEECRQQPELF